MGVSTFLRGRVPVPHRGLVLLALSETAVWYAGSVTSDDGGGGTMVWAAQGTTACRIDPSGGGAARLIGDRIDETSSHVVTVSAEAGINETHVLRIASRGTFDVLAAHLETDARVKHFEVIQLT